MRLGRLILVVATLITILVFPLVARDALQTVRLPNAYAQAQPGLDPAATVMQNDDDDDEDDDDGDDDNDNDDESDNEGEDEDNDNDGDDDACYLSLNSNEEVPCDFEDNDNFVADDNDNDGVVRQVVDRRPNESVNRPTKCFDTREVGVVQLGTGSYDVTVQVMPHSSLNQTTRLTLRSLNPSSVPAVSGGTLVDSVVYQLDAQAGCDGAAIGTLPNLVNMGIVYNVPNVVDKSKLQIVRLEGSSWVNVDTVPDPVPGNPYVSTTVGVAGTYALIQKP
jgi:hypothetical protein